MNYIPSEAVLHLKLVHHSLKVSFVRLQTQVSVVSATIGKLERLELLFKKQNKPVSKSIESSSPAAKSSTAVLMVLPLRSC